MGRIGKAVARRARGFGMPVIYHNRSRIDPGTEEELGAEFSDLKTLLSRADFVSLHVPLTEETKHFIGSAEINLMKKGAFLINTSRGPVVDERALLSALLGNEIAGAALDVYEYEPALTPGLVELDNIVLVPHIGSATIETREKMARMAIDNLVSGLNGKRPPHLVNPKVWQGKSG
jgi:glyoxylate reductase